MDVQRTVPGEPALEELFSAAYEELRRLASLVRRDDRNATMSPTTLVNEAFLKLAASPRFKAQSPLHFKRIAARRRLGRALVGQSRYAEAETELLAGYDILTKQTSPSVPWLRAAREDLVKLYTASNQWAKAEKYKAELSR